jgi:hypothetical protein
MQWPTLVTQRTRHATLRVGDAKFSADREVVASLTAVTPSGLEGLQGVLEALHRFKRRAVRAVTEESDA